MTPLLDRIAWFGTPLAATLLLHALLLAALALRFSQPQTVVARVPQPVAIPASLVSAESLRPKPKPKPASRPKPKPKASAKPKPKPVAKSAVVEPAPAPEPQPAQPEPQPKTKTVDTERLAAEARSELEAAIGAETAAQSGQTGSLRDTVAAIIQRAVIGRWTRPPSARNGMKAVLAIALVPTGDVVGVSVVQSSGNLAFDRSAINAVEKAARFPEVKQLERHVFERDFRRFQLIFRPEDLRY